ncbi:T6SS effector amidase Tae4 family protein [Erwinia papayae]|uniref:T6SS effector amidase Tae4 family protein n=1 Tax=Erwinia papayae TaxID=206499 RepID=A0ABV3N0Q5_9GAMM
MALSFESLWNAHPEIKGDANPCRLSNGLKAFDDQCAIRLGTALARCGCDVTRLRAAFCWHHPKKEGHVLRAEELALALRMNPFDGMAPVVKVTVKNFKYILRGSRGIIFFKDYWRRPGKSFGNRSGDHIDLWNGKRLTQKSTWFRIQWGMHWEGWASNYFDAVEVWFWKIRG